MQGPPASDDWTEFGVPPPTVDIKAEPGMDSSSFAPLSPPSSPSSPRQFLTPRPHHHHHPGSDSHARLNAPDPASASAKRVRPYHTSSRETKPDIPGRMSNSMYASWPSTHGLRINDKTHNSGERRPTEADQSSSLANAFIDSKASSRRVVQGSHPSIPTSSLTGAMGESHLSSHSQHSDSPSPPLDQSYLDPNTGMLWAAHSAHSGHQGYPGLAGQTIPSYALSPTSSISSTSGAYLPYNSSSYHTPSTASFPPNSPAYTSTSTLSYNTSQMQNCAPSSSLVPHMRQRAPSHVSQEQLQEEVHMLQTRVRDLTLAHEHAQRRIHELQGELAREGPLSRASAPSSSPAGSSSSSGGHLSPFSKSAPVSPSFQASWDTRTKARVKLYCSLNRAGNALCAWHDSRRERRAYPPRAAPPGHLNCGCTYEEALFEESLARHGVGSYHPGENVRMDPALRNPLLKLLQSRYGYRDGEFERDPVTGGWVENESHVYWEQKVHAGTAHSRKTRVEERR